MRKIQKGSYERLLTFHTTKRHRPSNTIKRKPYIPVQREMCECGKLVSKNIMDRHLKSNLHQRLIRLKTQCSE